MSDYYKLTKATRNWLGHTLHRIRYIIDIPEHDITAGVLGGWIEHKRNLQDRAVVLDDAIVCDHAVMRDHAVLSGNASMNGHAVASDHAELDGNASIHDHAVASDHAVLNGNASMYDHAVMRGESEIRGDAVMRAYASLSGNARLSGLHVLTGGSWDETPLYIQGSRWHVYMAAPDVLGIGCQRHTFADWRDKWHEIAKNNDALDIVQEYVQYYNLAAARYGFDSLDIQTKGAKK